jgi:hypothetical protein
MVVERIVAKLDLPGSPVKLTSEASGKAGAQGGGK